MKKAVRAIMSIILTIFIIAWPFYVFVIKPIQNSHIEKKEEVQWRGIIKLWDFPRLDVKTGSRYGWMQEKIKQFERQNPGVYIELTPIDWKKGPIKLEVALETGNVPDIAPIGTDFIYMNDSVLEPLEKYFTEEEKREFKYQALSAVTYDKHMWGVPFMMTTYVMYLNVDMFRQNGVDLPLDGNWTYEDFVEKMQKLTLDTDNDGKIDQYGFTSFIKPNYYNLWGIILSDGAKIIDEQKMKYVFSGEKAISGVNKVVDLKYKYKVTPDDFGISDENQSWDMFYNKKNVAVYATGSWATRVLEEQLLSGEGFEYAIANYPIGESRLPVSLNNSVGAFGIFKQQDEKKLDMCVKFLKFLTQEKYQKDLERLGVFPAKSNIEDMYLNNPKMKRIEDCLSYTTMVPKHIKWKDIDRILQNQIMLAIIGEKTTEEAIDEAKNQINQIINAN